MNITNENIKKLLENSPAKVGFSHAAAKEQIYICLNCLNSWEDQGFLFDSDLCQFTCSKCKEIVWKKPN